MADNSSTSSTTSPRNVQQSSPASVSAPPRRHHHHAQQVGVPAGTQTAQAIITGNGSTNNSSQNRNGPRTVVIQRQNKDFGFTLRHFIVYPPESCTKPIVPGNSNWAQPMDSIFVKEVHAGSAAHYAGLLEGDRLMAVNGVPVVGVSYPQVIALIQQTPKTLTLQVVPKNYDLIQAYFGDTAHNPETNRRQQIYGTTSSQQFLAQPTPTYDNLSERQESLYGTLHSLVQPMSNNIYSEPGTPSSLYMRPKLVKDAKQTIGNVIIRAKDPTYDAIKMQQRRESGSSIASSVFSYDSKSTVTNTSDSLGDSAIISRIRKSCEQKEEFLRRPSQPYVYNVAAASQVSSPPPASPPQRHPVIFENVVVPPGAQHPQHREFYSRPNRLQKAVWPPNEQISVSPTPGHTMASPPQQKNGTMHHMSIREQFFNSMQREPSPQLAMDAEADSRKELPHQTMRVVSELTKQFSSGRPLSPDGIDRMSLYKSELSRLQQKQVHPNVALRKREFELKAETIDWRRSLDKTRSSSADTESQGPLEVRARSLSAESSHTSTTTTTNTTERRDEVPPPVPPPRTKHHDAQIAAVRNTNAFWLQGPSNLFSLPPSAIPSAGSVASLPTASAATSKAPNFQYPPTRFPYDETQLRKMQSSRELKQAHRNQTIVEVHSDVEMVNVEGFQNGGGSATDENSNVGYQEKYMQPMALASAPFPQFLRPTTLNFADAGVVKLRHKQQSQQTATMDGGDSDKAMRRVSYLRATANDGGGFHIDSDFDSSPVSLVPELEPETPEADEAPISITKPAYRPWRRPRFTTDIEPLRKLFEESPPPVSLPPIVENAVQHQSIGGVYASVFPGKHFFYQSHTTKDKALSYFRDSPADSSTPVTHEGMLRVKITVIDGKRSHDRSWRTVSAQVRGNRLKLCLVREGKPNQSPEPSGIIDLTNFHLTEGNYTKRKHVFKLTTNPPVMPAGSPAITSFKTHERELLIQAENEHDMKVWMNVLRNVCRTNSAAAISGGGNDYINNLNQQVAEPQTMPAMQQVQDEYSPISASKTQRKYTFDSRSPSGQSPVTKSRKTPFNSNATSGNSRDGSDKETGSPKSKTWKGIVARQFRRIGGGPGGQQQEILPPEGASFGVPLSLCPPSLENPYVPMIVARCVDIVEAKGLSVIGIYRVPGNTAAISQLTEQVNRCGFDEQTLKDPRWEDVNVVSSLLKSFIRNLPEPLLPNDMYHRFIAADKLVGVKRLEKLKAALQELPPFSYETMKVIMRHLNRVSQNCVANLMESRNLAIVFAPSTMRCTTGTLESDVKDMRHQCQIVEALVSHYPYFFENEALPEVPESQQGTASETSSEVQSQNLLLDNVSKIELSYKESKEHSSRFVANIVQAANRKIRRTAARKSNVSSAVSSADTLSLDSTTSAESKGHRKGSYLSDSSGHGQSKNNQNNSLRPPGEVNPSSEDDSNDSAFNDNGSMSLTGVTIVLDNKLKMLRDTKAEAAAKEKLAKASKENINTSKGHRPLTLGGENIPFADESPERLTNQPRNKPLRPCLTYPYNNSEVSSNQLCSKPSAEPKELSSSDDTDTSTTSNPRENAPLSASTIRIEQLREMSRMLSSLEKKANHLERKISLNRSASLNYKNHKNECCCRSHYSCSGNINNNNIRSRLSLTKDEKTDKNISKRRQLLDSASSKRRGPKDRSIRRRHTVGGAHDYYNKSGQPHAGTECSRYIVTDVSSNTLKLDDEDDDDDGASDGNEYSRK